jgi:hypothetical protein
MLDTLCVVDAHTYMAGASAFFPIAMKASDMSWKQSSSTVSTVLSLVL